MARTMQQAGGALTGAGGTLGLYQFVDEQGDDSLMRPSVMYGLGSGTLAGAAWMADRAGAVRQPLGLGGGFWGAHAVTALVTGAAAAAFPRGSGGFGDVLDHGAIESRSAGTDLPPPGSASASRGSQTVGQEIPLQGERTRDMRSRSRR